MKLILPEINNNKYETFYNSLYITKKLFGLNNTFVNFVVYKKYYKYIKKIKCQIFDKIIKN